METLFCSLLFQEFNFFEAQNIFATNRISLKKQESNHNARPHDSAIEI